MNKNIQKVKGGRKEIEIENSEIIRVTRIYLLRHGEVENVKEKCYNGQNDVGLSPEGYKQIEAKADLLSDKPIRAIYSSDLKRCMIGASIIGRRHAIMPIAKKGLREKRFGVWERLTPDEIRERFREEWDAWIYDPVDSRPASGESYREVGVRVMKEVNEIIHRHKGEDVVIMAHGGVNRIILCNAINTGLENMFRIEQGFASMNIVDYYGDVAIVKLING
ncbi:MAG: histidine phosphatase family protein [Nitrospirota bacterium]